MFPLGESLSLLDWQFFGASEPPCLVAADSDDSGDVSAILDALYLLCWQFLGDAPPPLPGPADCGEDPTEDDLDCALPPECD